MQLEAVHAVEIKKPGGIYRQEGRPTNTDCENTPTQHQLSNVADS
jgi:hypothetical protein